MSASSTTNTGAHSAGSAKPKTATSTTKPCTILLGPLQLLRRKVRDPPRLRPIAHWLSKHIPDAALTVVERDTAIPSIVYSVRVSLSDEEFVLYREMIREYDLSEEFSGFLRGEIGDEWRREVEEREGRKVDLVDVVRWWVGCFGAMGGEM